jgi:hypothetical protein
LERLGGGGDGRCRVKDGERKEELNGAREGILEGVDGEEEEIGHLLLSSSYYNMIRTGHGMI